jgi:hypothetical protein
VGKVLADALAADDGVVDGRVNAGGPRHIFEVVKEPLVELVDEHEGIVAPSFAARATRAGVSTEKALGRSISQ